jgi:hypothetical protein
LIDLLASTPPVVWSVSKAPGQFTLAANPLSGAFVSRRDGRAFHYERTRIGRRADKLKVHHFDFRVSTQRCERVHAVYFD